MNSSIDLRKPSPKNKIKKRDNAPSKGEDRYSIASLLQKKLASRTSADDDKLLDEDDLHAVDAAIAQSEMMRKDTIATTSFSPIKTPGKNAIDPAQGIDESFLFIPQSPEEKDHCVVEDSFDSLKEESAPIKDDRNLIDSVVESSISDVTRVNGNDASKTSRRNKGKSVRKKHRSRNQFAQVENIAMPLSPPIHHDRSDSETLDVEENGLVASSTEQDGDSTQLETVDALTRSSVDTGQPTVLASEYLSIRDPSSSMEPLSDRGVPSLLQEDDCDDRSGDVRLNASAQDRLAIQAQRIAKFKNSIWSVVGGMVSPRRNTDYNQAIDNVEVMPPNERHSFSECDRASSQNHLSVTEEVELYDELSDNGISDFNLVADMEKSEVEEDYSNNDIYDFSNRISSNHSDSDVDVSENDSVDRGLDENAEIMDSERDFQMNDTVSTGSYNEWCDHSNIKELSSSDSDSENNEASSEVASVESLVNESGKHKSDNNMSFGSAASKRNHKLENSYHLSDGEPSYPYNSDDSNDSPTWRVDDNILDSEDNDVEFGGATKLVSDDEKDFTSRLSASIDRRHQKQKRKRMLVYSFVFCCVVCIVVIVILLVVLLPKSSSPDEAAAYNDACDAFPTKPDLCQTFLSAIAKTHPDSTWGNLMKPDKCQFKTLEWLVGSTSDDNQKLLNNPTRIRQRYALAVFHCELFGDEWFRKDFHLLGDDNECTWSTDDLGVESDGTPKQSCSSSGEIVIIRIKDEKFLGILTPELSMIPTLQELSLPDNHIIGSIPSEYSLLSELERVVLSSNQMTGSLPSFMYDVAYLDLSNNMLNGTIPIPPEYSSGATNITRQLDAQPSLVSFIVHTNILTGSVPEGLVHPWMKELVLHSNQLSGEFIPPSVDAAKGLERLTLNDNDLTGNVNSLCSLSSSNGGTIRTFTVDLSEITCSCCTPSESGNIFSPTHDVPKIPPPTMAPNISSTPPSSVPVNIPTSLPTETNMSDAPSKSPLSVESPFPTPGAIGIPGLATQAPTLWSNGSLPSSIPSQGLTSTPTTTPVLVFPFTNVSTTPLDPFVAGDCYFGDNAQPHVINQCNCYNSITTIYNDTRNLYTEMRKAISQEFYNGSYNTTIDSCQPQNQAMLWLSSGKTRDNGDLYQRYVLAVVYVQMNGIKWDNRTRWLSNWNECTWFGVECDAESKIRSIRLDANNVWGSLPSELKHLQSLETISVRRNQVKGTIPADIVVLPHIRHLILSNNNITGSIPSFLVSSTSLQTIQFDNNMLFGTIPPWIRSNSNLSIISLNNNGLYGSIPTELSTIQNLTTLYLHDNKLTGTIPVSLSSLTKLEAFTVYGNSLTGVVPSEICQLRTTAKLSTLIVENCGGGDSVTTGGGGIICPTQITCCTLCG